MIKTLSSKLKRNHVSNITVGKKWMSYIDVGDIVMLVLLWWWLIWDVGARIIIKESFIGDFFRYVGDFRNALNLSPTSWIGHQHLKLVTNTFDANIGYQHRCNRFSYKNFENFHKMCQSLAKDCILMLATIFECWWRKLKPLKLHNFCCITYKP